MLTLLAVLLGLVVVAAALAFLLFAAALRGLQWRTPRDPVDHPTYMEAIRRIATGDPQ